MLSVEKIAINQIQIVSRHACVLQSAINIWQTLFHSVWGFLVKIFNNYTPATALRSYSATLTSGYKRNILLMIISQVCQMHRIFKQVFIKLNNKQCRKTVVYRYKQPKQAHMKYNLGVLGNYKQKRNKYLGLSHLTDFHIFKWWIERHLAIFLEKIND